ncbi:zinc-dependent alcohol dehydrogenase [Litorihabitans aurantiacus]|uniref:Dehydrogenase n=1 Tax=Litorihabitans aurantiacus TaxID=1930061 RepID=A0AA38CRN4_9MICO|nr:zinc-binding alcohol dehydrogenase [Litorihabitans aurantiacus]GMA32918.1 dehydrogenase [Litorihabitans aurantiacus]
MSAGGALAWWATGPDEGELRPEDLPEPGPDDAVVRTLWSGISRGTETLVRRGLVPASQTQRMRAPFQAGDLPFPVKYGYLSVGVVEHGPAAWRGRRVFCLYPHQDRYVVPVAALAPVPDGVPSRRAVLAGTVETALNALWDAPPCLGDRVAVVGGGLVGGALALLLRGFPLDRLQVVEVDDDARRRLAAQGLDAVAPDDAAGDCDLVLHVSASESGLDLALRLLGDEAELVEVSWFGATAPRVPLGEDFHARRLRITASQVGRVGRARRHRRDLRARMATALAALADPAFDVLIGGDVDFADIADAMAGLGRPGSAGCVAVAYPGAATERPGGSRVQPDRP